MNNFNEKNKKNETQNSAAPAGREKTLPAAENAVNADENAVITVESLVTVNHNGIDHPKGTAWEIEATQARGLIECGAVEELKTDESAVETKDRTAGSGSLTAAPKDENAGRLNL